MLKLFLLCQKKKAARDALVLAGYVEDGAKGGGKGHKNAKQ
jgi:hypothetical protein